MESILTYPRQVFRDDHELLRQTVRRFLDRECRPRQAEWDREGRVDRETWLKAGREGLLCPTLDSAWGGGGGDFGHAAVIVEEIGRSGISGLGFGLHSDVVAPYIARLGTEAQKARWLPGCVSGETILAIAMSEPGAGSDLRAIRTTARREGDDYVIDGSKTFISNGLNCDLVVVVAKTAPDLGGKGVSLLLVEADRPGFRRGRKLDKMGQEAADTAELFFEGVRVPAGNLLGEENKGLGYLMQELAQERFVIALGAAAKLEAMYEETVRYTRERIVFGKPLLDMQNTRFALAGIRTRATAVRMMVDQYLAEHLRRRLTLDEAAMAKLFATEELGRALDEMLQLYGGYGYMMDYPICRAFVDSRVMRIYGGTSEVMKELIARNL
ncbi:acyl-CoA dehydrogenase family protein [Pseudacidovorax intermedius]|uniref:Acyl-[acyl-carrier-protein] dehydrogenase MbtN n=1 Tax=Pseudacidovorax intermedius TaxID=433924 RepID=A0A370FHG2_9BURK|nr:acyl-CoA dehydrogenase family protein [Pseudacidovorax intermedius]RDI24168.1 alkylation response protein AidB-like acyl-CoA dehydrogenase [Pseudacidovorax intermedius]